jgi:hypothetical protein
MATLGTGTGQANVAATATTYASLPAVRVTISRPQSALFSSMYLSVLQNSVSATAVLNGGSNSNPSGGCVLALGKDPTSGTNNLANAISLQGTPAINVPNCGIFSDSTDCTAGSYSESLGGNATITAGSLGSAGCIHIFGNAQVHLPNSVTCNSSGESACTQSDGTVSDPYAGTTLPSTLSGCTYATRQTYKTKNDISLSPGRYCGGLSLQGQGGGTPTATLSPGVYIFDSHGDTADTTLDLKKFTLTDDGQGVTLVFTCTVSGLPCSSSQWPSNFLASDSSSKICATAPTTGTTKGFVMMGDPAIPLSTTAQFTTVANSGPNYFNGTVWAPSAAFSWGGNATTAPGACNYTSTSTFCLQLIAPTR